MHAIWHCIRYQNNLSFPSMLRLTVLLILAASGYCAATKLSRSKLYSATAQLPDNPVGAWGRIKARVSDHPQLSSLMRSEVAQYGVLTGIHIVNSRINDECELIQCMHL
jgi:hypothetical protein